MYRDLFRIRSENKNSGFSILFISIVTFNNVGTVLSFINIILYPQFAILINYYYPVNLLPKQNKIEKRILCKVYVIFLDLNILPAYSIIFFIHRQYCISGVILLFRLYPEQNYIQYVVCIFS